MKTWAKLLESEANSPAPPSNPNKARCSSLPYRKHCSMMVQGPAGYPAHRGRAMHAIMEFDDMPFDIPEEEERQIKIAESCLDAMYADGWELFEKEKYLENDRLTGNLDIIFTRGSAMAYVDLKFGMKGVSNDSPQLAGGVELMWGEYGDRYTEFYSGIIQPFCMAWQESLDLYQWTFDEVKLTVSSFLVDKNNMSDSCGYCVNWMTDECPAFEEAIKELKVASNIKK